MIFTLEVNQGIYILSEEEGEIILPSDRGAFLVEDFAKTYVVNGEPAASSSTSTQPTSTTSLGFPLSYPARTNTNPPPGQLLPERPKFTVKKSQGWKKSLVVVEITSSGHVYDKYQVHLALKEENASVNSVEEMLKQQLGFDVCVLDSKQLPIISSETTKGSQFWRGSRKILVAKKCQMSYLRRGKGQKRKSRTEDILDQLKKMVSSEPEEEEDFTEAPFPAPKQSKLQVASRGGVSTQPNTEEEATKIVQSIFKCSICLSQVNLPAAVCASCYAVIGCVPCVEQWNESSTSDSKCPLCRTNTDYALIPMVREIANILGQSIPRSDRAVEIEGSDTDTIPYGCADEEYQLEEDFDLGPML
ncbi:hypothetical protein OS493_012857 [Desmophyllum pertusum]|uniref:RING-type domain-containing protein n=1 Tax=Desmophyllum pertusum TaxID=174260 RepID=A0A9W9Z3Y9_9CNID|nr:hypothetical protein OS493_012857 [Desmophyllum pertusum]